MMRLGPYAITLSVLACGKVTQPATTSSTADIRGPVRISVSQAERDQPSGVGVPILLTDPKPLRAVVERFRGEGVRGMIRIEYDIKMDGTIMRCVVSAEDITGEQRELLCSSASARRYKSGSIGTVTEQFLPPHLK